MELPSLPNFNMEAGSTESEDGTLDQGPGPVDLPLKYFSNCNGCTIMSAKDLSATQTINITMPMGMDSDHIGSMLEPTKEIDVNACNSCAVFNAVHLHTIQIINCIDE